MMMVVQVECHTCRQLHDVEVKPKDFERWKRKEALIQDCMPYLNADDRELLISKTCSSCFDKLTMEMDDEVCN